MTCSIRIFEKIKLHSKTTHFRVPQGQTSRYDRLAQICFFNISRSGRSNNCIICSSVIFAPGVNKRLFQMDMSTEIRVMTI